MLSDTQQLLLMHFASVVGVAALAFRQQIILRAGLLLSIALNIANHVFVRSMNGNFLLWDAVALVINGWILVQLLFDRTHIGLSAEEEQLFAAWGSLSPGEFRRMLRLGTWRTAGQEQALTTEGEKPDRLFYVLEGEIHLSKAGREIILAAPTFIGEVAFVKDRDASATVTVAPGSRYVEWSSAALRQYFNKHGGMRVAVMRLISADLAMKVARA